MTPTLEVVRAGAGSGKTTDLCDTVAKAVADGLDPARILATTFTRKAAAELKGRVQAQLLAGDSSGMAAHRHADRLELAAIGTVHSVAHQLLSRYAIEMGLSPRLEVITELVSQRALDDLLAVIPVSVWQPLADGAERLGVHDLPQRILKLLAAKRGNRIGDADFSAHMAASADRVCQLLAPVGAAVKELKTAGTSEKPVADVARLRGRRPTTPEARRTGLEESSTDLPARAAAAETPISRLYDLAEEALANIDALDDTTKTTGGARQKLRQLRSKQIPLWGSYLQAIRITAGKTSGADRMLDDLRVHATQVRQNPQLHADLYAFSSCLAEAAICLDTQYVVYKSERGLVDFTDLETLLLDLLEDEILAARLAEDFDLVLVDEFQDTNPLQLAIFQRLRHFSPRSRWVGDPKQAIYGFRDTDPELVNEIWRNAPDAARTELPDNYRSQRGLVQLVGSLFAPIFGDDAWQQPQKEAMPRGVERWVFDSSNQENDAASLACGIAKLHAEGIPFGDIAILERTNLPLPKIAAACDTLGIPYLLASAGLLSTREGAMILAGLRLVADRSDSLAAATVLHLTGDPGRDTPAWITERLRALREGKAREELDPGSRFHVPWEDDVRFSRIEDIVRTLLSPTRIAEQVIEALNLPTLVQRWGDPARRSSNLDSMLRHAHEYEELAGGGGQATTLSGMILYLEKLASDGSDVRYPPQGHDAVTLTTFHSAKGLEWSVVILSGLNFNRLPDMWSPVVTGGGRGESDPSEGRILRSWTWPFGGTGGQFGGRRGGSGLEDDALASDEGRVRKDRDIAENLRLLYVGCTRAKHKLVFSHREGQYAWLAQLPDIDSLLDCGLGEGEHTLEGIDTSFVLRRLNAEMLSDCRIATAPHNRWLSVPHDPHPPELVRRFHSPNQAPELASHALAHCEELPGPSFFPSGAGEEHYAAIGNAVHSYLAALPSLASLSGSERAHVAERCLLAYSVTGMLSPSDLVACGERFCHWVADRYPGARWHVEVLVSAPRTAGGHWNGTVDLLLQSPSGEVVIIDHKSAPIRREHCAAKAGEFSGQLGAYREVLTSTGETVESTWIHFPLAGVVARRS